MKPYYEHAGITIYHGDCRDVLPQINRADVILTDAPYGNSTDYASYEDTPENLQSLIDGVYPFFTECEVAAVTPGVNNVHAWPKPDWMLAWFIPAGCGRHSWGFSCWQPVLLYGRDRSVHLGCRPDAFSMSEPSEINGHPCPKPIGVWKWILRRISTVANEVILDPFMGSGTTLVAAKDLGHPAIGIEIEERYCEIAAKRLSQEVLYFGNEQTEELREVREPIQGEIRLPRE